MGASLGRRKAPIAGRGTAWVLDRTSVPVTGYEQNQVDDLQRSLDNSSDLAASPQYLAATCTFPSPHSRFARGAHFGSSPAAASHQGDDEPRPALAFRSAAWGYGGRWFLPHSGG